MHTTQCVWLFKHLFWQSVQTLILARRVTEALRLISQAVKVFSMSVGEVRLRPGGSLWWGHLIPDVDGRREPVKRMRRSLSHSPSWVPFNHAKTNSSSLKSFFFKSYVAPAFPTILPMLFSWQIFFFFLHVPCSTRWLSARIACTQYMAVNPMTLATSHVQVWQACVTIPVYAELGLNPGFYVC